MKETTVNVRKIVIRFLIFLLAVFAIWNGLWLFYRQYYFVRVANHAEMEQPETNLERAYFDLRVPIPENGSTACYGITCPQYLRFGSNYFTSEEPGGYVEQDGKWVYPTDYRIFISIHPILFSKPSYQLQIYDYKTANEQYLAEKNDALNPQIYTFDVDENMEIIQEMTYGGRAIYDAAYDDAYTMFCRAKAVFGL